MFAPILMRLKPLVKTVVANARLTDSEGRLYAAVESGITHFTTFP
jgi:hypothetical protein